MEQNLFLTNGALFAHEFIRVVHGQRGEYIEFNRNQILPYLVNHFDKEDQEDQDIYYKWLNPIFKCLLLEDSSDSYVPRTYRNATADVTLVFAIDHTTSGEICTKKAVLSQGKLFINTDAYPFEEIVEQILTFNKESISINIAGNGLYTFNKHNIQQDFIDSALLKGLTELKNSLKNENISIELIRSGGQTGADEAGIKAAVKLNIPALIVCPKTYKYRTVTQNIADKELFCKRFNNIIDTQEVKVYKQLRTVAYADYIVGKYYVSVNEFQNFKDPEKLF
jgi:hypothetical protein